MCEVAVGHTCVRYREAHRENKKGKYKHARFGYTD